MSDVLKGDQVKVQADRAAADIMAKFDELSKDLTDGQRATAREIALQAIKDAAPELLAHSGRQYSAARADSDDVLKGTAFGHLGLDLAQVELVHDVLDAARSANPRLKGPNEKTRAIVEAARKQRAMDTAESGFGAQLVADAMYVPAIWDAAMEDYGTIAPLIESRIMSGPVEKHPVLGTVPDMILAAESASAITGTLYGTQKVGTNEVTLTASKLLSHFNYSGELVEDSIVPFVGLLQQALAKSQAKTLDKLALNGDLTNSATGNINLDDADPADTLYYLAQDGIRHGFLVDATGQGINVGGALTYAQLIKLPSLMLDRTYDHHWGRPDDPNDLIYVGTPELDNDILMMDEVVAASQGRGALVPTAPIRGELFRVAGRHPYISTSAMALTEADGKVSTTANNNTLGQVLAFNRRGLLWGVRRQAQVEVMRHPGLDQWQIVLSTRVALGRYSASGAASGIRWVAGLYNITNS
jgi:HK97 family phage major capsid protein